MSQWFYAQQGQMTGPLSLDQLRKLFAEGKLRPSDLVWEEGTPQWQPASAVPNLVPPAAIVVPAPPPAAAIKPAQPAPAAPPQALPAAVTAIPQAIPVKPPAGIQPAQTPVAPTPVIPQVASRERSASFRLPTQMLTTLPKPILFGLFGALGCLLGAIFIELPFDWAKPPPPRRIVVEAPPPPPPKVDVMFVLDVTGSMQDQIDGVRKGIGAFVKGLRQHKLDVRVGLTYFRDRIPQPNNVPEDPKALTFKGDVFTADPKEFQDEMELRKKELKADGGGDEPESSLDALAYASEQKFRSGAIKVLLLITDASPHIPDVRMKTLDETEKFLRKHGIQQLHLIVKEKKELYQQLQKHMPGKVFNLDEVAAGGSFDSILPKVSAGIAEKTVEMGASIQSVQSTEKFEAESAGRLVFAICLWTAFLALGVSLALIVGQKLYLRHNPLDGPVLAKGSAGLLAGVIGGVVAQLLYQALSGDSPSTFLDILSRMFGWSLLGGLIGGGMALFVPNLQWYRGLLGGWLGGLAGALGFVLVSLILPGWMARWFGALILGFCIGLMVALAEMAFRRWWLEIRYSPRETRTVTLGAAVIGVGGDEKAAAIFIRGAPALALRYHLEEEKVLCEEVATGQRSELRPGDQKVVNGVAITVCNPASARGIGYTLELSTGKKVLLSEGLPLTAEELTGLEAQAADGTVALVGRKPSDPGVLLLYNRSRQSWAVAQNGAQRTIGPGFGLPLTPGTRINFGKVQGQLIRSE
jgi:Ca-activated chloride channel family protein